ncbi:hypothetical protein LT966_32450 [Streptomyces griseobrunneus]
MTTRSSEHLDDEPGAGRHVGLVLKGAPPRCGASAAPGGLRDLVRGCLAKDPAGRATLQEIADRTLPKRNKSWLLARVLSDLERPTARLLDLEPTPSLPTGPRWPHFHPCHGTRPLTGAGPVTCRSLRTVPAQGRFTVTR